MEGPTATDYKKYDQRTHVYMKSATYIGSDQRLVRKESIYDVASNKIIEAELDFPSGCEKIFVEILSNASDNVGRSRRNKINPGCIEVTMDKTTVTILNHGSPIPVAIHPEEKVYVPQLIFGTMLTSSNYEVERHEGGTNGIGAKATNIFSLKFSLVVCDHINKLKYTQVWEDNMKICHPPVIVPYKKATSSVEVSYIMDFERFGYSLAEGYPPQAQQLFHRHCLDTSFTSKVPVKFNGVEYSFDSIKEYARLYFGDAVDSGIIHYQWPPETIVTKKKTGQQVPKDLSIIPLVEMIVTDAPDEGRSISFANCMMTKNGGVHVEAAIKAVGDPAVKLINDESLKRMKKNADMKEKKANTITIADVRPHISLLLSVRVINPEFDTQTKTFLTAPKVKITIEDAELKNIHKWQLIPRLYAALEAKQFNKLTKTDGKLKKFVRLQKGIDANDAGKTNRMKCSLWLTEGNSGAGYANELLKYVPGGRDLIGVLPMRGKGLNVMNAMELQLQNNNEINELKKMLGLAEGVDYSIEANFLRLRYGSLMIMADSDLDGLHIIGLILLFFYCRFPSLLKSKFIMLYKTPTIRVWFNRKVLKFYTQQEYDNWVKVTPNSANWKHKYYKGLGTSNKEDVADDYKTKREVTYVYDDQTPQAMSLAFDKKLSDQRKEWIAQWTPALNIEIVKEQPISTFIDQEMILFSISNLQRAIPKLMDGFKESQRKVIFAAHLEWHISALKSNYSVVKVAQFASFAANKSNYHHNETILGDVVVGMAQNYVGSNNLPWFYRDGTFGCLALDTPVLLWSGQVKEASRITLSDELIGDDGRPRRIERIVRGIDQMYRVQQEYGQSYVVNSRHILTVRYTWQGNITYESDGITVHYYNSSTNSRNYRTFDHLLEAQRFRASLPGPIFDIEIGHLLALDDPRFVGVHNTVPINWAEKEVPLDPYVAGLALGRGMIEDKDSYLFNSPAIRSKFLAGIVDITASYDDSLTIAYPSLLLSATIQHLGKSLGLIVLTNHLKLTIEGDLSLIPSRRWKFPSGSIDFQSSLTITSVGIQEYVGWYIDGNERFLLGDFTVTHNTRYYLGKDAAQPRYIFTMPETIVPYILRKEDHSILKHIIDEGEKLEPETYYPIIPMILINGCQGIATGYSTNIPTHNLLDVIAWYKCMLEQVDLPLVFPWYAGYKGKIEIIERSEKSNKVKVTSKRGSKLVNDSVSLQIQEEIPDEEGEVVEKEVEATPPEKTPRLSMLTLGNFIIKEGVIVIDELPIGLSSYKYHKWLEGMVEQKMITSFRDLSLDDKVYFEIKGMTEEPNHTNLKLRRIISLSNMVVLDERNLPIKYESTLEILQVFFHKRLAIYDERKKSIMELLLREIIHLNNKIKFIQAVIDKKLNVLNVPKSEVRKAMIKLDIPYEIYDSCKVGNLSEDDIAELTKDINEAQARYDHIAATAVEQIWYDELVELENFYRKNYLK